MSNLQVIVAGFHRSGTSLAAQILDRAGVFLGDDTLPQHWSNPHGHFEDREIVSLHDRILGDNGLSWQVAGRPPPTVEDSHRNSMREFIEKREAKYARWGFKDPRVCLFLNTWKELAPDTRVLLVYRDPIEAAHSLHRRHAYAILRGTGRREFHQRFWEVPDLALNMWLLHNRALLDFARSHSEDVLTVSFDMLRRGFPITSAINRQWGLSLTETSTSDTFDKTVANGRDGRWPVQDVELVGKLLETWEAMEQLSLKTEEASGAPVTREKHLRENDFLPAVEAYEPLMEREFLSFQTQFLQDSLQEAEQFGATAEAQLEKANESLGLLRERLEADAERSLSPARQRELERAETDLRLIVNRLSKSRLAPLLRMKREFRELEKRYFE